MSRLGSYDAFVTALFEGFELGELLSEGESNGTDGTVALFADDDLGNASVRGILVVDLVAIDEED